MNINDFSVVRVEGVFPRLAKLDLDRLDFISNPGPFVSRLASRADVFTFTQSPLDPVPHFGYRYELENSASISLDSHEHWFKSVINNKTRNMIRSAEKKGVLVRESELDDRFVEGISEIYNESPIRQGRRFPHYNKPLEIVRSENATYPERSLFLGAYCESTLIGYIRIIFDSQRQIANIVQILGRIRYRDKATMNALLNAAVKTCCERGCKLLSYSRFTYSGKSVDSLADFKKHNGFNAIYFPRYYVPLNLIGHAALSLRLHHRFSEMIPDSALARLRAMREWWYSESRA